MKYKCCKCGGVSFTATCPIDINTDYIYEESVSTSVYCEDCDDFTNTIDIDEKEYNRIKKMPYTPKQYLVIQENYTIDGTYYWRIRYVIDLETYKLYKHNDYFANSSPISKELYNKKVKDI